MEKESSIEEILVAREERVDIQNKLLQKYSTSLVTFTMNIPGPVKNADWIQSVFEFALHDLQAFFRDELKIVENKPSAAGPQAFLIPVKELNAINIKRIAVLFENQHTIGRWFDIDIRDKDGDYISREQLAMKPRKCFLCGKDAKICARSRKHTAAELFAFTKEKLTAYLSQLEQTKK